MTRTIASVQQDFAFNCAHEDDIIWDFLAADQDDVLRQKIRHLISDKETGMNSINNARAVLFKNTWAQRKFTNGNLQSSIIYVMVTDDQPEYREVASRAQEAINFSCHPLIRTRKCMNNDSSKGCCMIFIDEVGRVYQNWKEYVEKNVLPPGFMVAPTHGVYTFDKNGQVPLLCCATPSSSLKRKYFQVADKAVSIGGIAAAALPVASLALPISAPIVAASAAIGLCTAAYSTLRSGLELKDRQTHKQSMSLKDSSARDSWLGLAGGVAAVGAAGSTKILSKAAIAGKNINLVSRCMVNGMNISSIILSGSGVANGVMDVILKWKDNESISSLNLAQFAASLVIFTHSVHNFRFAMTIANQARDGSIKKYRTALNNRQREVFDKMAKETIRIHGEKKGKIDIIRSFSAVPDTQIISGIGSALVSSGAIGQVINMTRMNNLSLLLSSDCGSKFMKIVFNSDSLENAIRQMQEFFSDDVVKFILTLTNTFIESSLDRIIALLKTIISAETILWKMFMHCKSKYAQHTLEFLESRTIDILDTLEKYFLKWNTIGFDTQQLKKCPHCVGYYSIAQSNL